jgi:lysophospholipase L1-like esterase
MPTILCYGDSNTWGCIPAGFDLTTGLAQRYESHIRWPGILQKEVGNNCRVVEEAINGRTTNLDDPDRPYKNGLSLLHPAIEAHYPIDILIFMLGTNDTKIQFNRNANEIGEGMRQLIRVVKSSNKGFNGEAPKVLIIAPQPIINVPNLSPTRNVDSVKNSEQLKGVYEKVAKEELCEFLDASRFVKSSLLDGVHLDEEGQKTLGKAVAEVVIRVFS